MCINPKFDYTCINLNMHVLIYLHLLLLLYCLEMANGTYGDMELIELDRCVPTNVNICLPLPVASLYYLYYPATLKDFIYIYQLR